VTYNFLYTANLTRNFKISEYANPEYEYVGALRDSTEKRGDAHYGMIFAVFKNKDLLPDPYTMALDEIDYSLSDTTGNTTTFLECWNSSYIFSEDRYNEIPSKTIYEVVDASTTMDIEELDGGGYSYSQNSEEAAKKGAVVKSFTLTYTER